MEITNLGNVCPVCKTCGGPGESIWAVLPMSGVQQSKDGAHRMKPSIIMQQQYTSDK